MIDRARHIKVVEDESDIAKILQDYLEHDGYHVSLHSDGSGVVDAIKTDPPDLVILDVMLPGEDGLTICRKVRQFSDLPIMIVTARVDEIDRLIGLELGADDYVCKPFLPREVVARVRSILRRSISENRPVDDGDYLVYQNLKLDIKSFRCTLDNKLIDLTKVEFSLLQTLLQNPGRVYSRDTLMNTCYADNRVVSDRTIDSHIRNLRRKLASPATARQNTTSGETTPGEPLIQSIYGMGYRLG